MWSVLVILVGHSRAIDAGDAGGALLLVCSRCPIILITLLCVGGVGEGVIVCNLSLYSIDTVVFLSSGSLHLLGVVYMSMSEGMSTAAAHASFVSRLMRVMTLTFVVAMGWKNC